MLNTYTALYISKTQHRYSSILKIEKAYSIVKPRFSPAA